MRSRSSIRLNASTMLRGLILTSVGMAASVSSAGPTSTDSSNQSKVFSVSTDSARAKTLLIHTPLAKSSLADISGTSNIHQIVLRSEVIVRTNEIDHLRLLLKSKPAGIGQVKLVGKVAGRDDVWQVSTQSVQSAVLLSEYLAGDRVVEAAYVDQGQHSNYEALKDQYRTNAAGLDGQANSATHPSQQAPGIQPVDQGVDPAGVLDPDLGLQWHLSNTKPIYLNRDNNIEESIYDVMGYTGAGVTVGIARPSNVEHLDFEHSDLLANFDADLTMPVDNNLFPADRNLTALAGVIAAERNNGFGGHGVAPGASFAGLSTGTDLLLSNLFEYEIQDIDIKVMPVDLEFTTLTDRYDEGHIADYVNDSYRNALKFGRGGKGTLMVFSGGLNTLPFFSGAPGFPLMPFYPDPYIGTGVEDIFTGNDLGVTEFGDPAGMNLWTSGPYYIKAQTYMYPFATNRLAFLINSVAEDGNADMNQAIGPGVFASVYTGTSNVGSFFAAPAANDPRGMISSVPGDLTVELPDRTSAWFAGDQFGDILKANGNSAAVAGGIMALMLEANPNLSIRDIQHIFIESIYDRPLVERASSIRFPSFDPSRGYMLNNDTIFPPRSFWQVNSAIRDTPNGPMAMRHSDQYGFGVIDAELAVSKAATWTGAPKLVVLDTGTMTEENDQAGRMPLEIPDSALVEVSETSTILNYGAGVRFDVCVRENIKIEAIVLELTMEGVEANDTLIRLRSPYGTTSNLAYPTTLNFQGTTFSENLSDDEADQDAFAGVVVGGTNYAFFRHEFTSYKHWDELSGGVWSVGFFDFGADGANNTGTAATDMDPAEQNVHSFGAFGVPGSESRTEKIVTSFRLRIYGSETNMDPFLGCDPLVTSCPGDLNADGIVDLSDFYLFINWYQTGDMRADMDQNGRLDFADVIAFRALFTPGECRTADSPPLQGGRPRPGTDDASDTNPPTHPI